MPIPLERATSLVDVRVLIFTALVAVAAGIVTSLIPALRYSRADLIEIMKGDGHRVSLFLRRPTFRDGLVIVQVGASILLLIGAGLLVRTLWQASRVQLGFDPEHAVAASTDPIRQGYEKHAAAALLDPLLASLRAQPRVQSAAIGGLPTAGGSGTVVLTESAKGKEVFVGVTPVSEGYFETVGIPLLSGRDFARSDGADAQRVAIVNQTMAHQSWPGQNPVGKRIEHVGPAEETFEIIGLVGNVVDDLRNAPKSRVYFPISQTYLMFPWQPDVTLLARGTRDGNTLVPAIRSAVASVDRNLPAFHIRTLEDGVAEMPAEERFLAKLLAVFATLATILAAAGVYGLISYTSANKTREFGIRMALGAEPQGVFWVVFRKGMLLTAAGLTLGGAAAIGLTRFLVNLLYGVKPADPTTFVGVGLLMISVTFAATYFPANRATRVDPIMALRDE